MKDYSDSKELTFQIIQSLRRIYKAINASSQEVLARTGVSLPQAWALTIISDQGSSTLGSLAKNMRVRPSTASVVVDKLSSKGYVTKSRSRSDQRRISIELTPKGKEIVKKYPKSKLSNLSHGLDRLKPEELKDISASLRKLVEIMDVQNMAVTFLVDDENIPESPK